MRVRLSNHQTPITGFLNIDPSPIIKEGCENQAEVYAGDIKDISPLIEDAECIEILAESLDYIRSDILIEVIQHWISKLRHGGRLILKGTNLESLTKKYLNGEITTLDFNMIIYGQGDHPASYKSGCVNLEEVCEALSKDGLIIMMKKLDDINFVIIGQRQ